MLSKIFGLQSTDSPVVNPPLSQPVSTAQHFVQRDVFFSDQSTRAVVSRFTTQKEPKNGLYLSFSPPNQALPVWDWLARPQNDMILADFRDPASDSATNPFSSKAPSMSDKTMSDKAVSISAKDQDSASPALAIRVQSDTLPKAAEKAVEKSAIKPELRAPSVDETKTMAAKNEVAPKKPAPHVELTHVKGRAIAADQHQALENAFKTQQRNPSQPTWLIQDAANPMILLKSGQTPEDAGFTQYVKPLNAQFNQILGTFLGAWFQLPKVKKGWTLPNGALLKESPGFWQNAAGRQVQAKQVMKAANGQWIEIDQVVSKKAIPFSNKKQLSLSIQTILGPLENTGAIREYPPVTLSAFSVTPFNTVPSTTSAGKPNPFLPKPAALNRGVKTYQTYQGMAANTPQKPTQLDI